MFVKLDTLVFDGLDVVPVTVEVSISNRGLPCFDIVGLATKCVGESRQRIKSAFQNSGIEFPNKKIVVNLAPADLRKDGTFLDLPIAVGVLCAIDGTLPFENCIFFGELSLDGRLRHTKGVFVAALWAKQHAKGLVTSKECSEEALYSGHELIFAASNLNQLRHALQQKLKDSLQQHTFSPYAHDTGSEQVQRTQDMFDSVHGQYLAKSALAVAAAGKHHMLMIGPPGVGKTLLAQLFVNLLPSLSTAESLETTKIHSLYGQDINSFKLIARPPFRNPHHSITQTALIGGGSPLHPGEITLAHNGVLFLDEFCEFNSRSMEVLRQPLESGYISLSRSATKAILPAKFVLIAAANPCPCGFYQESNTQCTCTASAVTRYRSKLSGPILDRIDLYVRLRLPKENSKLIKSLESSTFLKLGQMIRSARELAKKRFYSMGLPIMFNADIDSGVIKDCCKVDANAQDTLEKAIRTFNLSYRAIHKILRVGRTLADMQERDLIGLEEITQAIQFRTAQFY